MQETIVSGDSKSLSIACASIIAKVTRDRMLTEMDKEFSEYGFAKHKGYGTKAHIEAIKNMDFVNIIGQVFVRNLYRRKYYGIKRIYKK